MVDFAFFIFAFFCFYIIYKVIEANGPYSFPPGPWRLPVVGNSLLVKKTAIRQNGFHNALIHLSSKHNKRILGLRLGSDLFVIVFSKDLIKHVFSHEEFQARPDSFFIRLRTMGKRRGITMTDGLFWQEQRNFAFRHLRNLGFGKSHMESLIIDELKDLITTINCEGDNCDLKNHLARSVLNVLWALAAGSRFESSDSQLEKLLDLFARRSKAFDMAGGILSQLPFLAYVAPEWSGYNLICSLNTTLKALLQKTIDEHKMSLKEGVTRDFIDAFLHEMEVSKDPDTTFTEEQLITVCLDFFIAGSQTSSSTLLFAFLNMIIHQDVQKRTYQEIRAVLGDRKFPSLADRSRLPYVEAVLLESQRTVHVVPLAGPRRVLWDTTLDGYNIPKNTCVLLNLYSIHHDQEIWESPMAFLPERFLEEKNKTLANEMHLFGSGNRRCPGENLAKNFVFLIFTGILRNFHLDVPPGSEKPVLDYTSGIVLTPKPYKVHFTERN